MRNAVIIKGILQHLSTYSSLRDINPVKRSADMDVTRLKSSSLNQEDARQSQLVTADAIIQE